VFTQVAAGWFPKRTPAGSNLGEQYEILLRESSAPDDGRKHRPKYVEPTWNSKLVFIVHLVRYFHSCITMRGFMNVKQQYKLQGFWLLHYFR
jgi:hypothetical protein